MKPSAQVIMNKDSSLVSEKGWLRPALRDGGGDASPKKGKGAIWRQ
jgi:hypothetical protein